jgi:hypothetical protein
MIQLVQREEWISMRDAQGHVLSGATAEAVGYFDRAVRAFALIYGDAPGLYDAALKASPEFVMAYLGKAWPLSLANDPLMAGSAHGLLDKARDLPMNERERAHLAALSHAVIGHRASAVAVLDRHLMSHPFDLVAHMAALQMDGHLAVSPGLATGRRAHRRDGRRGRRATASCSRSMPLAWRKPEYARAEDTARAAAELEPFGYWPHHCVSHVMEMMGRPEDGLAWMGEREPFWSSKDNVNRVHIWWHKSLFHIELGQYEAALQIYDGPMQATMRPASMSICNAAALLWRLDMLGCEMGDRWQHLAARWEGHADGKLYVFPDIHAAMSELRAGRIDAFKHRYKVMRETAADGTELGAIYRDIGLPVVAGLTAFHKGAYTQAVDHLLPARFDLWKMGGSNAQRDVIDWTLAEAAVRAGQRDIALSLAHERLASRPESVPNRRFLQEAITIAS